ncbi:glycosyltransferase 87 family protein [Flexivirga oryzae]|uniref:DUF2029 domain-containing protein n=1 Tax=Flexivirga oryzae TaxID=1794944 RepID=A0A839NC85_9MICO|nr:glycosyltransferase 87 family protein [Flexivirga oryzae]MBB2893883.1 hypothetical protein [Flexivirga oryzae]
MQQPGVLARRDTGPSTAATVRAGNPSRLATAVVFVLALVLRLGVILRKGGIHGIIGYDCGVYFAGADALLHGRLPYRDFTMVHPPAITLALVPFAALTRVTTDWHAFIVATLAFCLLGAVNAVLVALLCRRLGIALRGAVLAGLFYAVWFGAISAEFQVKLEPLANFLLLLGLLALLRDQRSPGRWSALLAGAVIGLPMAVKIWWVVPVVLILGWHGLCRRSPRAVVHAALGAAASVTVVCLPFFLADPSGMWQEVVTGQLGRRRKVPVLDRLAQLSTVPEFAKHLDAGQVQLVALLFLVLGAAVFAFAWLGSRRARFVVVLTLAQLVVVLAAPSWFEYYSDYLAVGLAVCIGAAAVAVRPERLAGTPAVALTAAVLVVTCLVTVTGARAIPSYAGAGALTRAVRHERCVMSDNPTVLLRLDALSRGLAAGCPNAIDVTGRRMGPDRPAALRRAHRTWVDALTTYLDSGDAAVLGRNHDKRLLAARLRRHGVLAAADGHVVYRGTGSAEHSQRQLRARLRW